MKLGFMCGTARSKPYTIDETIAEVKHAEALGFDQAWMGQVFGLDAISIMTLLGRETNRIGLGTAVTPSFPRHPTSLAMQALTANAASKGRFELGLGLSHQLVMEGMFGIPYQKPASHMREYLEVLMPLLRGEACNFNGELFTVNAELKVPEAPPVTTIVAALGPKMLELAGRLADGTTTWMTGRKTLETHTIPIITAAANAAGKPAPRIVASFPVVLTHDVAAAQSYMTRKMGMYNHIPSYRKMLDIEGLENPADIALLGDQTSLREQLQSLREIGVTDFNAFCFPVDNDSASRTMQFLAAEKPNFA